MQRCRVSGQTPSLMHGLKGGLSLASVSIWLRLAFLPGQTPVTTAPTPGLASEHRGGATSLAVPGTGSAGGPSTGRRRGPQRDRLRNGRHHGAEDYRFPRDRTVMDQSATGPTSSVGSGESRRHVRCMQPRRRDVSGRIVAVIRIEQWVNRTGARGEHRPWGLRRGQALRY
jgi:hypothetical protein